ncbi:hypothetical protein STEG23_037988, partial [Scotinomys teguina]
MESTEKCEVVIQHFNGKYLKTPPGIPATCSKRSFYDEGQIHTYPQTSGFLYLYPTLSNRQVLLQRRLANGNRENNELFALLEFEFWGKEAAPSEPLLCKFADGGQKKRQNQSKYTQNGRPWPREGE